MTSIKLAIARILASMLAPIASVFAADTPKPNILFVLADDRGNGAVRCDNANAKVPARIQEPDCAAPRESHRIQSPARTIQNIRPEPSMNRKTLSERQIRIDR
jgi:hypothetical protein